MTLKKLIWPPSSWNISKIKKTNKTLPVVIEGIPFVLAMLLISGLFSIFNFYIVSVIFLVLACYVVWFFRNPTRHPQEISDEVMICPADGRVVFLDEVEEGEELQGKYKKISVFMNIFNVHVNYLPIHSQVLSEVHYPGDFINAIKPEASWKNERQVLICQTYKKQQKYKIVQVAGLIARRIVCYARPEDSYDQGESFGLIRFGSRVDLYVPLSWEPQVKIGDKVVGGETILFRQGSLESL